MNKKPDSLPAEPPSETTIIRCPRLGHQIDFTYCRSENSGLPCFKTLDCWFSYFDVHAYLTKKLTREKFERAFQVKTKPKVLSLLELIEQAKKNKGKLD